MAKKKKKKNFFSRIKSTIMGGDNTGNKDAQTTKSYKESGNVPENQSKQRTQLDRLTAKYGEGFRDTSQGRMLQDYLDGVSVNRGGNMGADNDSFYDTGIGNEAADRYRKSLTSGPMGPGYNREELITGINTDLARQGLSSDDYYKFNQTLREQDANAYDTARPFSSGQTARNFAQIAPGLGMVSRGVESLYNTGKDKAIEGFEAIKEFALQGPDEAANEDEFSFLTQNNPVGNIHTMKKGGIVHAADGVFAESETMEMPLTLPEIKRHRKKLEAGFQYDIEVDGRNQSFSFDEQLSPSGIETLRERESITPFDTGLNMYGGGQFAEGNTPEARQALEVLKSIDPNQPGNFHMQGGTALDYKANGGYMSSFPNQNLNTESLSASDNIDDRIMKNLQFEKMSPGMMGYNTGGIVEPMAPDFNSGF